MEGGSQEAPVEMEIANLPEGQEKEKAEKAADAAKAAIFAQEEPVEASANDAQVKEEIFDEDGFLLPSAAAKLAASKQKAEGSTLVKPVGLPLTILLLEETTDNMYENMKADYKLMKRQMKVTFLALSLLPQSPSIKSN